MRMNANEQRTMEIKLIHVARRNLNIADDTYRALLQQVGNVSSSADLDAPGRRRMLDHFAKLGFVSKAREKRAARTIVRPAPDREKLLTKIDALLLDQGRDRRYIEPGMVQRVCKVDALSFCTPEQLTKLIAALTYDKNRKSRVK